MPRKVAFLHIEKTGGTTIHRTLADYYGQCVFYPPCSSPFLNDAFGADLAAFEEKLEAVPEERRSKFIQSLNRQPFIGGHTHKPILKYLSNDRVKITSLREPFDRFISAYFHHVHPEKSRHVRPFLELTRGFSPEEFAAFEPMRHLTDNAMVRAFSSCPPNEPVVEAHLEEAVETLSQLDRILFVETLNADLKSLLKHLRIPRMAARRLKVSQNRINAGELMVDRSRLEPSLHFDVRLYALAWQQRGQ